MTADLRVLSIHKTLGAAIRSARNSGGIVRKGVKGTTTERPWAVVVDKKARAS
jgi:hypothetical protein